MAVLEAMQLRTACFLLSLSKRLFKNDENSGILECAMT